MDNGTLGTATVNPGETTISPSATETPDSSAGQESVASETAEQAEGSQESSDGGSVNGNGARQRGKSVYSQVRELQSRLREQRSYWETEVGGLKSQLEEIRRGMSQGQQGPKQGKVFWDAPGEVLAESLLPHLADLKKELKAEFESTQSQREEQHAKAQEISEAAKFIRSQKGMTQEDIEDIRDILQGKPYLEQMPPMEQAQYALMLWQQQRGIGDKSAAKNRASSSVGTAPAQVGKKNWTESEINAELAKFPSDPSKYTPEDEARFKKLDDEWRLAYRENRVTK